MRKISLLLIVVLSALQYSFAAPRVKTSLKVGTWEIGNEAFRAKLVAAGKTSPQRSWDNCAQAVAAAIVDTDCDVIGLQDIGDVIGGRGNDSLSLQTIIDQVAGEGKYKIFVPSNKNPNYPLDGHLGKAAGIIWKTEKLECMDWGINWLSGLYDKPGKAKDLKFGDGSVAMVWVKFREIHSGKIFVFASAGSNGPTQYDNGKPIKYHEINVANCTNLIRILREDVVPDGIPSIFVLNSRNSSSSDGYKILNSSVWLDVWDYLHEQTLLSEDAIKQVNTMNSENETKLQGGRPDHIFINGFVAESYAVLRNKYPTADGTLHYPALHFPVVARLKF